MVGDDCQRGKMIAAQAKFGEGVCHPGMGQAHDASQKIAGQVAQLGIETITAAAFHRNEFGPPPICAGN